MELKFNKTGAERKALVAAIGEILGTKAHYLGAPSFAFAVGGHSVSKDGTLAAAADTAPEELAALAQALLERGFVSDWQGEPDADEGAGSFEETAQGKDAGLPGTLSIEVPSSDLTGTALENLQKLAAGKAALIRMALGDDLAKGAEALPILIEGGKVCFPWFRAGLKPEGAAAWAQFTSALCATAKKQKRVILKQKELDEGASPKFAMRCFLLKLGFIGEDSKEARRVILAGMPGNGSHKTGNGKKASLAPAAGLPAGHDTETAVGALG